MLRNYLTVALRTLRRSKGYTALNVGGLALGLAACLLIGLYVRHELSYDRFHQKAERIYRLAMRYGTMGASPRIPARAAARIARQFSEVEAAVRLEPADAVVLRDGQPVQADHFFYADSTFFEVFDGFDLRHGDPQAVLAEPNTAVLTPSAAERYVPGGNPVGQTLTLRDGTTLRVTGIAEEPPSNSHLAFGVLASFATLGPPSDWPEYERAMGHQGFLYMALSGEAAAGRLERELAARTERGRETITRRFGFWFEGLRFGLQPLTAIHVQPFFGGKIQPEGSMQVLYILALVALCVLLLATVNYANLATARAARRAKEVGMRRTLGAYRRQVAGQFLGEAVLTTLLAVAGALILGRLLLPGFESLMDADLAFSYVQEPHLMVFLIGGALLVGLLGGAYPALVLSRFEPAAVLSGSSITRAGSSRFRKGLVVFQFAISIALVACTFGAYQQLRFTQEKDLGFRPERVVTLSLPDAVKQQAEALRQEMRRLPSVKAASVATSAPGGVGIMQEVEWQGRTIRVGKITADTSYVRTLGMQLVAGRGFEARDMRDSTGRRWIANATAARLFDLKDDVGGPLPFDLGGEGSRLVGIVHDFHTASLREPIRPFFLSTGAHHVSPELIVHLRPGATQAAVAGMRSVWEAFAPDRPFEYAFLNDALEALYRAERRLAALTGALAGLAVVLACLGLFGLAAFAAERRTKEIAIRKTFGASARQIVVLLSKEFVVLVGMGFLIAVPVAWWAMRQWLESFAYRIELSPLTFAAAGVAALIVAMSATGWQALRAARTNPAWALRNE